MIDFLIVGMNIKLLCSCVQEVGTKTENYNNGVMATNRISNCGGGTMVEERERERKRERRKWERESEVRLFLSLEIGLEGNKWG